MNTKYYGPITDEKLYKINNELSEKRVPKQNRPDHALQMMGFSVPFDSPESKYVRSWFISRSRADAHTIGAVSSSIFFYDTEFWQFNIPLVLGCCTIHPLNCLQDMPKEALSEFASNRSNLLEYAEQFENAYDFGTAQRDIINNHELPQFGRNMFDGGCRSLSSAVSALSAQRPDPQALLDSRQTVENFFKAAGSFAGNINEKEARKIGHNLKLGLEKFQIALELTDDVTSEIQRVIDIYPLITSRYESLDYSQQKLWKGFKIAQYIGALITRRFSSHTPLELNVP